MKTKKILCVSASLREIIYTLLILFLLTGNAFPQASGIIPEPQKVEYNNEWFVLSGMTIIKTNSPESDIAANILNDYLYLLIGKRLSVNNGSDYFAINEIVISEIENDGEPSEEYSLGINGKSIVLKGSADGLIHGIYSLIQLIPVDDKNKKIRGMEITDYPKFGYRGMHLDVCRHFFTKDEVKRYIDFLALYKMNYFHWHLTEDQGWRIEIKKYPKLTEIGAYRNGTLIGHAGKKPKEYDDLRYGGFYTQEDIKEIVAYANERKITVIPEIEMPGHSLAALASYPEFSCTGGPFEVEREWGVFEDVYCTKEETFKFLEDVLSEVAELFPSPYIHIGGDECPKARWKNCPACQQRIKDEGLKDENELQSYFITRIEKFLNSKGKTIIGWDEILEGGLAPNAVVMSWRGTEGGIEAAKMNHYVIMTPVSYCYFDYYQGNKETEPLAIGGFTPVEKVYAFDPVPDILNDEEKKFILGAQANLWTEYIPGFSHVEYMIFPRICALSEVVWSYPSERNFENFKSRLINHFKLLDVLKINYCKEVLK
ncbi:MAG: beta-N-acetylhexosaminidase [Ignavibacteria bacterium]|nr:beta-N-acetylhexosaminidase [Ignavibacteria bacterium]